MKALNLILITLTSVILMGCQVELSELNGDEATQTTTENSSENTSEATTNDAQTTTNTASNAASDESQTTTNTDTSTETETTIPANSSIALIWEIPVERENNDRLYIYDLGGYEIEYRKTDDTNFQSVTIDQGDINSYVFSGLESGDYEFRIAAFDTNGLYSKFSESTIIASN